MRVTDIAKLQALLDRATKGPWQVHGSHFYGPDPGRILIGQMWGGGPFDANLALIAVAPDLAAEVIRLTAERDAASATLMVRMDEAIVYGWKCPSCGTIHPPNIVVCLCNARVAR